MHTCPLPGDCSSSVTVALVRGTSCSYHSSTPLWSSALRHSTRPSLPSVDGYSSHGLSSVTGVLAFNVCRNSSSFAIPAASCVVISYIAYISSAFNTMVGCTRYWCANSALQSTTGLGRSACMAYTGKSIEPPRQHPLHEQSGFADC